MQILEVLIIHDSILTTPTITDTVFKVHVYVPDFPQVLGVKVRELVLMQLLWSFLCLLPCQPSVLLTEDLLELFFLL